MGASSIAIQILQHSPFHLAAHHRYGDGAIGPTKYGKRKVDQLWSPIFIVSLPRPNSDDSARGFFSMDCD
jgi:hypothetical protein